MNVYLSVVIAIFVLLLTNLARNFWLEKKKSIKFKSLLPNESGFFKESEIPKEQFNCRKRGRLYFAGVSVKGVEIAVGKEGIYIWSMMTFPEVVTLLPKDQIIEIGPVSQGFAKIFIAKVDDVSQLIVPWDESLGKEWNRYWGQSPLNN